MRRDILLISLRDHCPLIPAHLARARPPFSVCWRGCLGLEVVACSVHGYNRLLAELDGAVNLQDPRARVNVGRWAQQLTFDLFGLSLVARLAASLIATLTRPQTRLNPVQVLLCGYLLLAFGVWFLVRLKELRQLIGVLLVTALIIGASIGGAALVERI